ncbi:MAG: DUF2280 domain-containing protein [Pyrinomonadaceae bacterium]
MPKGKLKNDAQIFVVMQLAMFEKATIVREQLKQIHGVEIELPAILHYDIKSQKFPEKWRELFVKTRASFIKDTSSIWISHKAVRLSKIQRMFETEESQLRQNKKFMRELLEQAAKESGDAYTNRLKIDATISNKEKIARAFGRRLEEIPDERPKG